MAERPGLAVIAEMLKAWIGINSRFEEIPDILIIRVDVLVLFHRLRHLMYTWWPIWGRGGGVSFIFVSIHLIVHVLTVLTFFFFFYMYNYTTEVSSTGRQLYINSFLMDL